jgi:iron-sulfur cluster assembly accessory protein
MQCLCGLDLPKIGFIKKFMISLTDSAVRHLKTSLAEKSSVAGYGLRLRVEKGGCAGMQYVMQFDHAAASDQVHTREGVSVIIDLESLKYLQNCELDYEDSLNDSGFKLRNPNAARSCGCGTSFEPQSA